MREFAGEAVTDARFAEAWRAAEWLISPDPHCRRKGIDLLIANDALSHSPLVVHLLASRLDEPDLDLRRRIVAALAQCLETSAGGAAASLAIRDYLAGLLGRLTRLQVESLLETDGPPAASSRPMRVHRPVVTLLDRIPNLAGLLTRIAADRSAALPTRSAAVAALGELGVIEALPALEGLKTRIEGQAAGQMAMAFAPSRDPGEETLLEVLKGSIEMLLDNE